MSSINFDTNVLNDLTTKLDTFISNDKQIYSFNSSLNNKLQIILKDLNELGRKIQTILSNIDNFKQQLNNNETTINDNTEKMRDLSSELERKNLNDNLEV